jgi:hypothetical protein
MSSLYEEGPRVNCAFSQKVVLSVKSITGAAATAVTSSR